MTKFWDKINGFLDKHFEVIEKPAPEGPPVRKYYKITVYTGYYGEEECEYYSTADKKAVLQYAKQMRNEYAEQAAMEHYWRDAGEWETEEEFYKRFRKQCGYRIDEISKDELLKQKKSIWRLDDGKGLADLAR